MILCSKIRIFFAAIFLISMVICSVQAVLVIPGNTYTSQSARNFLSDISNNERPTFDQIHSSIGNLQPTPTVTTSPIHEQEISSSSPYFSYLVPTVSPRIQPLAPSSSSSNSLLPAIYPSNEIISEDEAISIASNAFDNIIITEPPVATLKPRYRVFPNYVTVWSVKVDGIEEEVAPDSLYVGRAGGTVVLDAKTGDIIVTYQVR